MLKGSYLILLMSGIYSPNPAKGGVPKIKEAIQQAWMLNEDQILRFGSWVCHERSSLTTEKYLTVAIPVIVNKEFNPVKQTLINMMLPEYSQLIS